MSDLSKKKPLPEFFSFRSLGTNHLNEIFNLINNHYIEDSNHIIRLTYSKDFIYWYLKQIPPGLIVGLLYKTKLIGLVTSLPMTMIISGKETTVPYIDFLCIQINVRELGLCRYLLDELNSRLITMGYNHAFFTGQKRLNSQLLCTTIDHIIPINYPKLKQIGFLVDNTDDTALNIFQQFSDNPLHFMTPHDIETVVRKLNKFMEKFTIRPLFTKENAHYSLLPKKNIVYSFVKRDSSGDITDFISVYKNYLYCSEKNKIISVAQLAFYFYDTLNLTELVLYLLQKLPSYKFDQLVFRNMADNADINITKFIANDSHLHHYLHNISVENKGEIHPSKIMVYPF